MKQSKSNTNSSVTGSNPRVDKYFSRAKQWQAELAKLRAIILDCPLTEELKWGQPCYAFEGGNVVIIQGFKKYCALLYFKGALLKDPKHILVKTGPNAHVGRQIRFNNVDEVAGLESILKAYIRQAIEVEKAGLRVKPKKKADLAIPEELQTRLNRNPALKTAFNALTPGRQRAYAFYLSGAKQAKTRESRVDKCVPLILEGKGLNE